MMKVTQAMVIGLTILSAGSVAANPATEMVQPPDCWPAFDWEKNISFWPNSHKHDGGGNQPDGYEMEGQTIWRSEIHESLDDGHSTDYHDDFCIANG